LRCTAICRTIFHIVVSYRYLDSRLENGSRISMALRDRKEERIESRLPLEAKRQIEYAAELQGRSVSDFVVSAALDQACKVIEQQKVVRLSIDDSKTLAEAILNPPEPNAKAIAAARRYKEKMGD
jgi:uncharacterized protein (DUF1778 family)